MRLEGCKADLIRSLIALKRRELEDVCTACHMPVPPLPEVDASVEAQGGPAASAQVTMPITTPGNLLADANCGCSHGAVDAMQ